MLTISGCFPCSGQFSCSAGMTAGVCSRLDVGLRTANSDVPAEMRASLSGDRGQTVRTLSIWSGEAVRFFGDMNASGGATKGWSELIQRMVTSDSARGALAQKNYYYFLDKNAQLKSRMCVNNCKLEKQLIWNDHQSGWSSAGKLSYNRTTRPRRRTRGRNLHGHRICKTS